MYQQHCFSHTKYYQGFELRLWVAHSTCTRDLFNSRAHELDNSTSTRSQTVPSVCTFFGYTFLNSNYSSVVAIKTVQVFPPSENVCVWVVKTLKLMTCTIPFLCAEQGDSLMPRSHLQGEGLVTFG